MGQALLGFFGGTTLVISVYLLFMAFQGDSIFWVEVEKIVPNPFQPRREFDEDKLKELAESVRMYGILQPLTVTRKEIQNEDGSFRNEYELIAGERRLRASKMAGVAQVPVIIREGEQSEQEKLELAIIENLQREDLNAVDRAIAFRQLADVFGLSHAQVAKKMGRSREYVSNSIRLLALPDYMLKALRMGDIAEGHCRALLMLNDRPEEQDTVFRETLLKKLSVRDVERISRGIATEKMRKKNEYDAGLLEMEKKFTETLGTRVSITKTDFGGRLSIDYFTQEELEEILEGMRREASKMKVVVATSDSVVTNVGYTQIPQSSEDSRAEELVILTERTGLEFIPEEKPMPMPMPVQTYVPTSMPEPEYITQPARVEVVPETVSSYEAAVTFLPAGEAVQITEYAHKANDEVLAAITAPEPVDLVPDSQRHDLVTVKVQESFTPVVAPAQPVVNPPAHTAGNSLKDQLASLLGRSTPIFNSPQTTPTPVVPVIPVAPVTTAPTPFMASVPPMPSPQPVVETPPPIPVAPAQPIKDDSDLYSIRDFSI